MTQQRSNTWLWILVVGGILFFFIVCLLVIVMALTMDDGFSPSSFSSEQIASLEISGTIDDSKEFVDELNSYGNRSNVKSVIIRIDSPGGGVAASQEIYEAIKKFREETRKPVVVSMASTAASGGYYIACAADKIFANPGTITGSIGVITQWYDYSDVLRWAKMQHVVIKSGELKDAGSGSRPLTEKEKAYFQALIDDLYGQFVSAVAESRDMEEEEVRKLADGRVFSGREAKEHLLIDEIGTFQDAVDETAKMSGISGKPRLLVPIKKRRSALNLVLGDAKSILPLAGGSGANIRFEYLWR